MVANWWLQISGVQITFVQSSINHISDRWSYPSSVQFFVWEWPFQPSTGRIQKGVKWAIQACSTEKKKEKKEGVYHALREWLECMVHTLGPFESQHCPSFTIRCILGWVILRSTMGLVDFPRGNYLNFIPYQFHKATRSLSLAPTSICGGHFDPKINENLVTLKNWHLRGWDDLRTLKLGQNSYFWISVTPNRSVVKFGHQGDKFI